MSKIIVLLDIGKIIGDELKGLSNFLNETTDLTTTEDDFYIIFCHFSPDDNSIIKFIKVPE